MRGFLAALSVLTMIPVGKYVDISRDDLRYAKFYFPLVGLILGAPGVGIGYLILQGYIPLMIGSIFLVLLPEYLNKFFHLDGLADSADGFFSSRTPDKILDIMRDSRLGAMGAVALIAVLALKFAAYYEINEYNLIYAIILAPVAGRCCGIIHIELSQYARMDGLGAVFFEYKSKIFLVSIIILLLALGGLFTGSGLLSGLVILIWAIYWSNFTRNKISGATGDTIGCAIEMGEMLFLLTVAVGPQWSILGINKIF